MLFDCNWYVTDTYREPVIGWHNLNCTILSFDGSVSSELQKLLNDWNNSKDKYWLTK